MITWTEQQLQKKEDIKLLLITMHLMLTNVSFVTGPSEDARQALIKELEQRIG